MPQQNEREWRQMTKTSACTKKRRHVLKNVGMGGKCFVGAREATEGRWGHVTRVDDVTVRDTAGA